MATGSKGDLTDPKKRKGKSHENIKYADSSLNTKKSNQQMLQSQIHMSEQEDIAEAKTDDSLSFEENLQLMAFKEKQRQAEASKQMLYTVYGHCFEMLEEYERRTEGEHLSKSKLDVSDHSWKTNEDIQANLESQLMVFQLNITVCPSDVTNSVIKELREKAINWAAVREVTGMPQSQTDYFIAQLYEILVRGSTHHQTSLPRQTFTKEVVQKTLPHIWYGNKEATEIDNIYEKNPSQKASGPNIRTTGNAFDIKMGADRIRAVKKSLNPFLQEDIDAVLQKKPVLEEIVDCK